MDPNETLRHIREWAQKVISELERGDGAYGREWDAASNFSDLDDWLSKGGFLPDAWLLNDDDKYRFDR